MRILRNIPQLVVAIRLKSEFSIKALMTLALLIPNWAIANSPCGWFNTPSLRKSCAVDIEGFMYEKFSGNQMDFFILSYVDASKYLKDLGQKARKSCEIPTEEKYQKKVEKIRDEISLLNEYRAIFINRFTALGIENLEKIARQISEEKLIFRYIPSCGVAKNNYFENIYEDFSLNETTIEFSYDPSLNLSTQIDVFSHEMAHLVFGDMIEEATGIRSNRVYGKILDPINEAFADFVAYLITGKVQLGVNFNSKTGRYENVRVLLSSTESDFKKMLDKNWLFDSRSPYLTGAPFRDGLILISQKYGPSMAFQLMREFLSRFYKIDDELQPAEYQANFKSLISEIFSRNGLLVPQQ